MRVLVVDKNKKPLMPCHAARAREMLSKGRAIVFRKFPFTILLLERDSGICQNVELKIDPGSKTTGIALVGTFKRGRKALWAANLNHKGEIIKQALTARRAVRRGRRTRLLDRSANQI